jgi:hypothetical protein
VHKAIDDSVRYATPAAPAAGVEQECTFRTDGAQMADSNWSASYLVRIFVAETSGCSKCRSKHEALVRDSLTSQGVESM